MKGRHVILGCTILLLQSLFLLGQSQDEICVPQFVNGSLGPFRWETTVMIQNQEQAQAQIQLRFFQNDGQALNNFQFRTRMGFGKQFQVGSNGLLTPDPVRERSMMSLRSAGQGPLQIGFCLIQSQGRIQAQARLHVYDSSGTLLHEAALSNPGRFLQGSFFADLTDGRQMGVVVTNPSAETTANCRLEIFAEDGVEALGSVDLQMGPHSQSSKYLFEYFPDLLTGDVGFVRITCDNPVCALALQLKGLSMLQVPIFVEIDDSSQ